MKNFFREDSNYSILLVTFAPEIINNGALAHLARAFDWQSRGDEFESRMLHMHKGRRWRFRKRAALRAGKGRRWRPFCMWSIGTLQ